MLSSDHPRDHHGQRTLGTSAAKAAAGPDEARLVDALRERDEHAFTELVERYHRALLGVAIGYVRDRAAAEDVVQETWIGLLQSIDRFEGRCSLKTWLFRILFNKAQNRVARDRRLVPFSTLAGDCSDSSWADIDPTGRPFADDAWTEDPLPGGGAGWWMDPERAWTDRRLVAAVRTAIGELPPMQGTVIRMRDVEGYTSAEVCEVLDISPANQRVLLHRARVHVRRAVSYGNAASDVATPIGGAA